jgi:hypothetical protein
MTSVRLVSLALLLSAPALAEAPTDLPGRAQAALLGVLAMKTSWEQMHAAEALVNFGQVRFEAEPAVAPFRTNVWRLLAMTARTPEERHKLEEKIAKVALDPQAPDRYTGVECSCKLGHRFGPKGQAAMRKATADPSVLNELFGWWALAVAGQPGAMDKLVSGLDSKDPAARSRVASSLRWLHSTDPKILQAIARVADAEPVSSPAYASILSSALILKADPARASAWRDKLERALQTGPGRRRWEACQGLMLDYTAADLPKVVTFLDDPHPDSRTGAASTILYVLSRSP